MWIVVAIAVIIVFLADMFAIDPIPFIDEIVLAIGTIASFKKAFFPGKKSKKSSKDADVIDVDEN